MSRTRRAGAAIATLVAVALVGAACGSGASKQTQQTTANRGVNEINPLPYDQVKQGGTLQYPLDGKVINFNVNEVDGNDLGTVNIMAALMPSLFITDANSNFTYNPDYLTGEPKVTTKDGHQTVTYEINPKAKWADGTQISAADFIAQWQALNGKNNKFKFVSTTGYDDISSVVQGANPQEVVATFNTNFSEWRLVFTYLYPASTNSDPSVFNDGWVTKPLTTAGPFTFQSQDTSAQTYTLVPNPAWWGRKPKLDKIVYRVVAPDAQPAALDNNEIDFLNIGPDATKYAQVKAYPDVDIRSAGGPNFRHVTFNGSSAVLSDVKTRQGIAMGIDRNAITNTLLSPLGVQGDGLTALNNHVFMKNQTGYQDNSGTVGKFDPTAAAALLDAQGWKLQGSTRVNDGSNPATASMKGKPLELNFVIPAGVATSQQEAQLIQKQLGNIGVKVNINTVDGNHFFDQYVIPGHFDLTVFSWIGSAFPISGAASIYQQAQGGQWGQNFSRVGTPQIDALFKKALSDLDPKQAIADANAADMEIFNNVLSLPTYQRPDLWGARSNLVNFGAFGFASPDYTNIGFSS